MKNQISIPAEIEAIFHEADDPARPLDEINLPSRFAQARKTLPVEIAH